MADFEHIQTQVLSGAAADVTFSNLGNYKHLYLLITARCDRAQIWSDVFLRPNSDAGINSDNQRIHGAGNTNSADEGIGWIDFRLGFITGNNAPANAAGVVEVFIIDYKGTTLHKGAICQAGWTEANTTGGQHLDANYCQWRNTAAITSLLLRPTDGNFMIGSTFSLYGIRG